MTHILHVKFYNYGLKVNECVPLWNLYTCYFNYTDVGYGGLNPFKQPYKGMDFVLRYVKVMYTMKQLTFTVSTDVVLTLLAIAIL